MKSHCYTYIVHIVLGASLRQTPIKVLNNKSYIDFPSFQRCTTFSHNILYDPKIYTKMSPKPSIFALYFSAKNLKEFCQQFFLCKDCRLLSESFSCPLGTVLTLVWIIFPSGMYLMFTNCSKMDQLFALFSILFQDLVLNHAVHVLGETDVFCWKTGKCL